MNKTNPLIKYGVFALALLIIVYLYTSSSGDGEKAPPPPKTPGSVGTSDSAQATLQTLIVKEQERVKQLNNLEGTDNELKGRLAQLEEEVKNKSTQANPNQSEHVTQLELKIKELEKRLNNKEKVEKVADGLSEGINDTKQIFKDMEGRDFSVPGGKKNPLNDYDIGQSALGTQTTTSVGAVTWVNPIDQQMDVDKGVFIAKEWTEDAGSSVRDSVGLAANGAKKELEPKAVFTIPENTSMIGAKLASRIIALIPKGGSVSPMGFKIKLPADVLAANGFQIPELAEAFVGGYAVGNFSLSCARGYVTSFTFVFSDGRISQVGSNLANSGQEAVTDQTLAVLTDIAGTECVTGTFLSDAEEFIGTNMLLGAAAGAASAYSGAQQTVRDGADSSSSAVTGSVGKYVGGLALQQGVNQGAEMINELWAESWSAVVVDIGTKINLEVKKEIRVDYDPVGRKIRHDFTLPSGNEEVRNYWQ